MQCSLQSSKELFRTKPTFLHRPFIPHLRPFCFQALSSNTQHSHPLPRLSALLLLNRRLAVGCGGSTRDVYLLPSLSFRSTSAIAFPQCMSKHTRGFWFKHLMSSSRHPLLVLSLRPIPPLSSMFLHMLQPALRIRQALTSWARLAISFVSRIHLLSRSWSWFGHSFTG